MIRRIGRSLPWLGAVAALLLLALPAQADDIEPEPFVEEEVEAAPEPEVVVEEEIETASESDPNIDWGQKEAFLVVDLMVIRPLYFVRLAVGLPFFAFYPLTLASGWSEDVVMLLWTEPFEATFARPLGALPSDY